MYKIIKTDTIHELERLVNLNLQEGWTLCGGLSVVITETPHKIYHYHQAMQSPEFI
jgi:hypothetical protein